MKKLLCLLICVLVVMSSFTCFADSEVTVLVNGTKVEFDQQPVIQDGRTLVPLRKIFEALGAVVGWDNDTNTVIAEKDDTVIMMQIGNKSMYKNNEKIEIDVPPVLLNDRTLVPVRAIAESFNLTVGWDEATWTVTVD